MRELIKKVREIIQEPFFFSDLLMDFLIACSVAVAVLSVAVLVRLAVEVFA